MKRKFLKSIVIGLLATATVLPANLMHISAYTVGAQSEMSADSRAENRQTMPTTLDGWKSYNTNTDDYETLQEM